MKDKTETDEIIEMLLIMIVTILIIIAMLIFLRSHIEKTGPQQQEPQEVVIRIVTEESFIESSDDELTISIGQGEDEVIIKAPESGAERRDE